MILLLGTYSFPAPSITNSPIIMVGSNFYNSARPMRAERDVASSDELSPEKNGTLFTSLSEQAMLCL